jgi:hypothetical protein
MRFPIKITKNLLVGPFMRVFGAGPSVSYVDLEVDAFEVRMGPWFKERFPLAEVSALAPSEWPWWGGLGVKTAPRKGIGVVGSSEGVVNVQFKTPQPVRLLMVPVKCAQLWMSFEDPDGFLRAMSDACKVPISAPVPFWRGERRAAA